MGDENFYKTTIRLDKETYEQLNEIAKNKDESLAFIIREHIKKGLAKEYVDESKDIIATLIREQLEIVLKPSIERLAALSSKSGHMSATATFLNVQALMDLVPTERRKDVRPMYESARKKAAEYMRTRTEDWKKDI
jgi:predicted DNA-binding protein